MKAQGFQSIGHPAGARVAAVGTARVARPAARRPRPGRRGLSSLLAMLYLVLFSALALGFYAQTSLNSQITANEKTGRKAMYAAESGSAFIRHQLSKLEVRYCPEPDLMNAVYDQLVAMLDGTPNLEYGLKEVGATKNTAGKVVEISIPKDPYDIITLGEPDYGFRAQITRSGRQLVVKIAGYGGREERGLGRGVQYTYSPEEIPAPLLSAFGIASNGQVSIAGNSAVKGNPTLSHGSVYITTKNNPVLTMTGPSEISGDVYIKHATATTSIASGCRIGQESDPVLRAQHIHMPWPKPVTDPNLAPPPEPEMPVVDTAMFKPYVLTKYASAMGNKLRNVTIPAGTGKVGAPLKLAAGATVDGVVYVESPNVIEFSGDCTITGLLVGDNYPADGILDLANNVITFSGLVRSNDASKLDPAIYGEITTFTGTSLATPRFDVRFSGGYAAISGSICSAKLTFSGKAGGNITGSVIGMSNQILSISGSSEVWISRPLTPQWPAGMFFRSKWVPVADTYLEVQVPRLKRRP